MGMDSVEIVLRAEEFFSIALSDEEVRDVETVGQFYVRICEKLSVVPLAQPETRSPLPSLSERKQGRFFGYTLSSLPPPPDVLPFTAQSIWDCVVTIFVEQMALRPAKVRYDARIGRDLGVC